MSGPQQPGEAVIADDFPALWRFPELWVAQRHGRAVSHAEAVDALLRGYAESLTPELAFERLLGSQQFDAAKALLANDDFVANVSAGLSLEALEARLAATLQNVHHRWLVQRAEIVDRARRIGKQWDCERLLSELEAKLWQRSVAEREERIARLLAEIEAAEVELRERLLVLFSERCTQDGSGILSAECQAIERALEQREYGRAEWLLERSRPTGEASLLTPAEVARVWPRAARPREVCSWLLEEAAAPAGFLERWAPPRDDVAAAALTRALANALDRETDLTSEWLDRFAANVTAFLAGEGYHPGVPSTAAGGCLWNELTGLSSPWLPALTDRLRLAVPDPSSLTPIDGEALSDLVLLFDPHHGFAPAAEGPLRLTPESFFRLMKEPSTRKATMVAELAAQMPLQRALPEPLPVPAGAVPPGVRPLDALAMRLLSEPASESDDCGGYAEQVAFLRHFLTLYGVRHQHDDDLDRILFLGGGRPRLLQLLLRELLGGIADSGGRTRRPLSRALIQQVWDSAAFKARASRTLLAPLAQRPDLRLVIGAIYYQAVTDPSRGSSTVAEVADFIADPSLQVPGLMIAADQHFASLCGLGLIEEEPTAESGREPRYRLPSTGVGLILSESLASSLESFLEQAAGELRQ